MALNSTIEIKRRVMDLVFVIDDSGSMNSQKTLATNNAMLDSLKEIKHMDDSNDDVEIVVSVIIFSTRSHVEIFRKPIDDAIDLIEYYCKRHRSGSGGTSYTNALREVNSLFGDAQTSGDNLLAPVIIFISDGYDNRYMEDGGEYLTAFMEDINYNDRMFKEATKIAVGIRDEDEDPLTEPLSYVVGDERLVVETIDTEALAQIIQFVSISASQINSQVNTNTKIKLDKKNKSLNSNQVQIMEKLEDFKETGKIDLSQFKKVEDDSFDGW